MQYALAAAALVGAVSAQWGPGQHGGSWGSSDDSWGDATVTDVKTAWTTFCPEATQFSHSGTWYSVTAPTTLIITYPTTSAVPVTTSSVETTSSTPVTTWTSSESTTTPVAPVTESSSSSVPVTPTPYTSVWTTSTTPVAPVTTSVVPPPAPYPSTNGTTVVPPPAPYSSGSVGTTSYSTSSPSSTPTGPAPYTGAGNKVAAAAGAGLLAVLGFAAAL